MGSGALLNHGGVPFFWGGGAAMWPRCPPPPAVMGSGAHFRGCGQHSTPPAAVCPPPPPPMDSGARSWGGEQHPIPRRAAAGGLFLSGGGGQRQAHSLCRCSTQGGAKTLPFAARRAGVRAQSFRWTRSRHRLASPRGGNRRGQPAARLTTIRGVSPPWMLRSRTPSSARKRPR